MTLVQEKSARITRDPAAIKAVIAALAAQHGNRLVTSQAVREQHANTTTWIENQAPDAVVFPQTTEDVQAIVRTSAPAPRSRATSTHPLAGCRWISAT